LEQPVGVGFSYFDENGPGVPIDNSPDAAEDFYTFLQLFFTKYPEYSATPLHIAAESYGGTYAPYFAHVIHRENKILSSASTSHSKRIHINLESIILANAMSDPLIQMGAVPEYLCGGGPFSVPPLEDPNGEECHVLRNLTTVCQNYIKECYDLDSSGSSNEKERRKVCSKAGIFCDYEVLDYVLSK
jgi:cathepsin A (carboxypeptidase C)